MSHDILIAHLRKETQRRLEAEREIERLRGCMRGVVYKLGNGDERTARDIVEHCLKKSLTYYPHPIEGAPPDPTEVKR